MTFAPVTSHIPNKINRAAADGVILYKAIQEPLRLISFLPGNLRTSLL